MVPPPHAIRTRTCTLWCEGDIVFGRFHEGAEVDLADAHENLAVTATLTGGRRLPVMVDLRGVRSQSAEARAHFAGPAATAVTRAVALVISSPLSRVVGNFFLGFNRPETPARIFTATGDAETWLASFQTPGHER